MLKLTWLLSLLALLHAPQLIAADCHRPNPATSLTFQGGSTTSTTWSTITCPASLTSDFASRDAMVEYNNTGCWGSSTWGPYANQYPAPTVPLGCYQVTWAQKRVLAVIDKHTKMGWNYCHHHTPSWQPPVSAQVPIPPSSIASAGGNNGTCSAAGVDAHGNVKWNGIDCSHFSSFVYNYGLGMYLTTAVEDQACGPNAPGRILPVSKNTTNLASILQPGDLLYLAGSSSAKTFSISHVIHWTGIQLTYDNGNFSYNTLYPHVPANQQSGVAADVAAAQKAGTPLYVIADSHNAGPNYRIFAGWWARAFSHARRIINPDPSLPTTSPNLVYDSTAGTCTNLYPGVSPVPGTSTASDADDDDDSDD